MISAEKHFIVAMVRRCKMVDCDSTTAMRYSTQTKQFWKLGWKIFGGKFVNCMADYKSHGNTTLKMSQRGNYPHQMLRFLM